LHEAFGTSTALATKSRAICGQGLFVLLFVCLLCLAGSTETGYAQGQRPKGQKPLKGVHVERVEQKRTDTIAWVRVQVVADKRPEEAWAVLEATEEWADFLRIFSQVTALARTRTMTRYRFSVSPPWPLRDFDSTVWMAELPAQHLILWRSDREKLTRSHGRIEVQEIADGVRVSYEIHSPVESAFPPWVVRLGLYLVLPGIAQDFYDRIDEMD
jgi:hypothetical protein